MVNEKKPKKKTAKSNREPGKQRKHELAMAKLKADNELMRDIVKYVGEDLRSQLLLVALTGTSIAALIAAYKAAMTENEALPEEDQIVMPSMWLWVIAGSPFTLLPGLAVAEMFDINLLTGTAANPWAVISQIQSAATTTAGLAWAALFASIIVGEGGLGGILDKAGGGGFGAVSSLAGAV